MKMLTVLPVSVLLVGILFCPMGRAAPPIPEEFEIVAPDPLLPKELSAFFGKYEGYNWPFKYFLIVARIDKENAILYMFRDGSATGTYFGTSRSGWETIKAEVIKERGRYQLWYRSSLGGSGMESNSEATLDGKFLKLTSHVGVVRLTRVP